jgi:hypothetical protein
MRWGRPIHTVTASANASELDLEKPLLWTWKPTWSKHGKESIGKAKLHQHRFYSATFTSDFTPTYWYWSYLTSRSYSFRSRLPIDTSVYLVQLEWRKRFTTDWTEIRQKIDLSKAEGKEKNKLVTSSGKSSNWAFLERQNLRSKLELFPNS